MRATRRRNGLTTAENNALWALVLRLTGLTSTSLPYPKGLMRLRNLLAKSFEVHRLDSPDRWGNMVFAFFQGTRAAPDAFCEEALLALAAVRVLL
jgi:hypothetical protein